MNHGSGTKTTLVDFIFFTAFHLQLKKKKKPVSFKNILDGVIKIMNYSLIINKIY